MENPKQFILRNFPIHLDIEATSRCNLRCTFCDKLPLMEKGQLGDIDIGLYKKIIDEGEQNDLCSIKLSYRGEPLLHPRIVEMVHYAKEKGILDVYFNTNGMLLTAELSKRLIDAGLDRISISIEGTDPEKFETARVGAKFSMIFDNVKSLMELKAKMNVDYPRVRIQSVFLPDLNVDEYKRFWEPYCDEVAVVDYKDESKRISGLKYDWACPQLWQRMTIEWDGTVLPCNNDDLRQLSPGNANQISIKDCWNHNIVNDVRRLHRSGSGDEITDCNGCPWRTAQIMKLMK